MSVGEMLWWKLAIEANRFRYSYGGKLTELFLRYVYLQPLHSLCLECSPNGNSSLSVAT